MNDKMAYRDGLEICLRQVIASGRVCPGAKRSEAHASLDPVVAVRKGSRMVPGDIGCCRRSRNG